MLDEPMTEYGEVLFDFLDSGHDFQLDFSEFVDSVGRYCMLGR